MSADTPENVQVRDESLDGIFFSSSEDEPSEALAYPRVVGTPVQNYHCTDCERSFTTKSGLSRHENQTHIKKPEPIAKRTASLRRTANKKARCDKCNRTFNSIVSLSIHNRVHKKPIKPIKNFISVPLKSKTKWKQTLRERKMQPVALLETPIVQSSIAATVEKKYTTPIPNPGPGPSPNPQLTSLPIPPKAHLAPPKGGGSEEQGLMRDSLMQINQCSECCLTFKDPKILSLHIATHTTDRLYRCVPCNLYFIDLVVYSQHKC